MTQLPFDVIHHIDMHMKLLDEETLLIGQYPVNRADYAVIENTVAYLATLLNCYGRHYRIIRIPMPPDASGRYPDNGSNYLTYTNSLIINKTVLVPIYSLPTDQQALQVYRDAMPGYTVISYDCNAIIPQLGAIHCITKEIGVREPLHISHAYLTNTSDTVNDYRVSMKVSARSGIDSAGIFWRTDTTTNFTSIAMVDSSGIYVGYLPHQSYGKSIWYYLSATSGSGRTVSKPLVGPLGAFRFDIGDTTLTSAPEQTFPQTVRLFQNYPNPFNPVTTIRYTIPSSAHVQIKVYNLVGQEIETLYQGDSMAGSYSVIFDASKYASGVYFFRLSAFEKNGRSSVQIQKGLLLK